MLKSVSRRRSAVGRISGERGPRSERPRQRPPTMRTGSAPAARRALRPAWGPAFTGRATPRPVLAAASARGAGARAAWGPTFAAAVVPSRSLAEAARGTAIVPPGSAIRRAIVPRASEGASARHTVVSRSAPLRPAASFVPSIEAPITPVPLVPRPARQIVAPRRFAAGLPRVRPWARVAPGVRPQSAHQPFHHDVPALSGGNGAEALPRTLGGGGAGLPRVGAAPRRLVAAGRGSTIAVGAAPVRAVFVAAARRSAAFPARRRAVPLVRAAEGRDRLAHLALEIHPGLRRQLRPELFLQHLGAHLLH